MGPLASHRHLLYCLRMDVAAFLNERKGLRPLAAARHELGYSVEALASTISVGAPTIRNAEWGIYANIPPRIKAFYTDNYYEEEWLDQQNGIYRFQTRVAFGEEFGHLFPAPRRDFLKVLYRNLEVGRLTVAKCLCVQPAELLRMDTYEEKNFPDGLAGAIGIAINYAYAEDLIRLWQQG